MKISDITIENVVEYLKLDDTDALLPAIMLAAQEYILSFTGLTLAEADEHPEFWVAYMVLVQDMFDNRTFYVEKNNVNKVVDAVLSMHRRNLLV